MFFLIPVFVVISLIQIAVDQTNKANISETPSLSLLLAFVLAPLSIIAIVSVLHFLASLKPEKSPLLYQIASFSPYIIFFLMVEPLSMLDMKVGVITDVVVQVLGNRNFLIEHYLHLFPFLQNTDVLNMILARFILLVVFYVFFVMYLKTYQYISQQCHLVFQTNAMPEFFSMNRILSIGFLLLFTVEIISLGSDWQESYLNSLLAKSDPTQSFLIWGVTAIQVLVPLLLPLLLLLVFPLILPFVAGWHKFPPGSELELLQRTAQQNQFKYRAIYLAPTPGLVTAGVIGFVPWATNLVFTKDILKLLNEKELEAVMLHEIGHVKHYHVPVYFAFLSLLQFVLMIFAFGFSYYDLPESSLYVIYIVGLLLGIRYGWGWLSRQCERQADLHAAEMQNTPHHLATSFLKISALGMPLDKPSWHHGSLRERIDHLMEAFSEKGEEIRKQTHRRIRLHKGSILGVTLIGLLSLIFLRSYLFSHDDAFQLRLLYNTAMDNFKNQDYVESSRLLGMLIQKSEKLQEDDSPTNETKTIRKIRLIAYYNRACALALAHQKEEAIENLMKTLPLFEKEDMVDTFQEGLNVKKITSDTDLDFLRADSKFQEYLELVSQKEKEFGLIP